MASPDAQLRQRLQTRHGTLKTERSTWDREWKDIAKHMRPYGFRDQRADANEGQRKGRDIINNVPLIAARTLAGGMMTGITSPARPWFRLTVEGQPQLMEVPAVKWWLSDVERGLRLAMAKSNIYSALHSVYADLGPFGVSAVLLEEDAVDGLRAYHFPIGSYVLALGSRGDVNTCIREVSMTVAQVVELFGLEACSAQVREKHKAGQLDTRVDVTHFIGPNPEYQAGVLGPRGFPVASYWWESGAAAEEGFLRKSGYEETPFMAPRWEVTGEDTYGHGPGWFALPDCRALQLLERRAAQAAEKIVAPPMSAPTAAITSAISLVPGAINFVDSLGQGALRPAVELRPETLVVFREKIREHEVRINRAFFADLWLSITQADTSMTAREVSERREEKLQQLGTVLEQLGEELLDPLIDRVFGLLQRAGRLPPAPEEMQGMELKVEYVSIAAAAQKVLSTTGLERIAGFAMQLASAKPDVLDKLDVDQLLDEQADALGVVPAVIRPDDAVEALRQQREAQRARSQQLAAVQSGAEVANKLAGASLENPNALTEVLRGLGVR